MYVTIQKALMMLILMTIASSVAVVPVANAQVVATCGGYFAHPRQKYAG